MDRIKIGIIGGSGIGDMNILKDKIIKQVTTDFGEPSSPLTIGKIEGVDCVLLSRHGIGHTIPPSKVNYRANMLALKNENCTHVIVSTACGSLQADVQPGDLVVLDQYIDRTTKREQSYYDGTSEKFKGICHIPQGEPFCQETRKLAIEVLQEEGLRYHDKGTMVTIEGPRFSSQAESNMFRMFGGTLVNMTTVPEVVLANELGMCYQATGLVTDYDSWKTDNEMVDIETVFNVLSSNADKMKRVFIKLIPKIAAKDWDQICAEKQKIAFSSVF